MKTGKFYCEDGFICIEILRDDESLAHVYQIPLEECRSIYGTRMWLRQLGGKEWIGRDGIVKFLTVLEDEMVAGRHDFDDTSGEPA